MRKLLGFAELAFTVLSLLLYTGGPLTVIITGGASQGDGLNGEEVDSSLIQLIFLLNYVVTFLLLVARWKKVIYALRKEKFILALVGVAVFSVFWSVAPAKTIRRGMALVGTTMFGLYLATRYSVRQQLQLLGWMFGIAATLSVLFALVLPKYGIMGGVHAGSWRGIYPNKNSLGQFMSLSAMIFCLLAIGTKRNYLLLWCGFGLSLILLLLSASTSSLVNLVILLTVLPVSQTLRWHYKLMIPALIVIGTAGGSLYVWFKANTESLLASIGKDPTLTGRTEMWPFVLEMIGRRPLLGYGYNGFWLGWKGEESSYVWSAIGWEAPNSHNGWLELWLDVGLLGVSIYLIRFWTILLRSLIWVRLSRKTESLWPLIFLVYTVLANLTESAMMGENSILWVLYVALNFSVINQPQKK